MSKELKPCPFCGAMPETDGKLVQCYLMPCDFRRFKMPVEAWNTRPIEDDLRKRIAELEAESERFTVHSDIKRQDDKWIPVSERLPDNWKSVLTIDISKSTRDMVTAFYNPETLLWVSHFSDDLWVTHWMPLPESPIVYGKEREK